MTFKDVIAQDIHNVFLNSSEFAEIRTVRYDGEEYPDIPVSLQDLEATDRQRLSVSGFGRGRTERLLRLLEYQRVDPLPLITHRFTGLDQVETAFHLMKAKPPELVKAAFELKLMSVIGFAPLADACAYCGRTAPEAPLLDIREGVVRCKGCGKGMGGLSMPLSDASLAALRRVLYGEAKRLYSFKVPQEDLKKLADAAEAYVHAVLERGFKTLDFYKGLVG